MINKFKQRLAAGEVCVGAWTQAPGVQVAEAMASCGFDWLAIDMEHATLDVDEAQHVFLAAERYGVAPLVRLPKHDPYLARRLLDAGAMGLILPVTEDAGAFAEFASYCYYPPKGKRGVGLSRPNLWGETFKDYFGGFEPALIPQIESRKGVENIAALAALPCVDAVFVGPYDLTADLGKPGDFDTPEFKAAMKQIQAGIEAAGKPMGAHVVEPNVAKLKERIDEGYRLLAFGTDLIALRYAFRDLRPALGR